MKTNTLFILLIALVGCQKISYQDTPIQGHAINLTDGTPLVGYEIHLVEIEESPEPFGPVIRTTIASDETDSKGQFGFNEELRKRDRFYYEIVFDPGMKPFMSDGWQADNYSMVASTYSVRKGQFNGAFLGQVPIGNVRLGAVNQSNTQVTISCIIRNHLSDSESYGRDLAPGQKIVNQFSSGFSAGEVDLVWYVTENGVTDSLIVPFFLEHGGEQEYILQYPFEE